MDQALDHNPRFWKGLLQFTLHHSWVDLCDINDLHFSYIFPGYDAVLTEMQIVTDNNRITNNCMWGVLFP